MKSDGLLLTILKQCYVTCYLLNMFPIRVLILMIQYTYLDWLRGQRAFCQSHELNFPEVLRPQVIVRLEGLANLCILPEKPVITHLLFLSVFYLYTIFMCISFTSNEKFIIDAYVDVYHQQTTPKLVT